jgi:L-ascorbate metabolism protein UlaG (beta-lactamase superfamily)
MSPVPSSLHLLDYQVKTMSSYLENPDFHFNASQDPNFIGGRYVDISPERVSDVEKLLVNTVKTRVRNLEFAKSIIEFYNWLVNEAKGQCLESYYQKIPDVLRGYVELTYDYYDRPSVRFLEGMLYESKYYDKDLHSLRIGPLSRDESRSFFMSTPRLLEKGQIDWKVPFESEKIDDLFRLDLEPQPLGRIRDLLGLKQSEEDLLLPLLSEDPILPREKWNNPGIRFRYFGHACVLIEWEGGTILTDPYIGVRPVEDGYERYSYQDLPEKIDYILITHNHQDHFALETLLRLRNRTEHLIVPRSYGVLYGDVSLRLMAKKVGFKCVTEMETLESIRIPGGQIVAVPFLGEHGDLAHGKSAYVVQIGSESILFAADSDCLDNRIYTNIRESLGPVETVFLGMECVGAPLTWSCGPLFPKKPKHDYDQTRRYHGCNSKAALELLETVGANRIYNYAMGEEPWVEFLLGLGLSQDSVQIKESNNLISETRDRGFIESRRLFGKDEFHFGN